MKSSTVVYSTRWDDPKADRSDMSNKYAYEAKQHDTQRDNSLAQRQGLQRFLREYAKR